MTYSKISIAVRRWSGGILAATILLFAHPAYAQEDIEDRDISTIEVFSADESIVVGSNVVIEPTGNVSLGSPLVVFSGPIYTKTGSQMYIISEPFVITGNEDELDSLLPAAFSVDQNYPNPFKNSTNIRFELSKEGFVEVYNLLGQKVADLMSDFQNPGAHTVTWNGRLNNGERASNGVYVYVVSTGEHRLSRQMTMLK